jgi:hypothetical protein
VSTLIDHPPVVVEADPVLPRHVYVLSMVLAVVAWITAALTFFLPDILLGPAVTNGNARGTALVVMALAVPMLLIAVALASRGSTRAIFALLGSVFYLGYNAFLFLFMTPFNRLFLLNVALLSLSVFTALALTLGCDRERLLDPRKRFPHRQLAILVWVIVALNAAAWLAEIVPAIIGPDPLVMVEGTGVATNAIYIQDLAVWLPLMGLAAWGLWNQRSMGVLLTGSWLFFGVIEAIGIAVDQWFGHQADPTSPLASVTTAVAVMGVLLLVNLFGVFYYLRAGQRLLTATTVNRRRTT